MFVFASSYSLSSFDLVWRKWGLGSIRVFLSIRCITSGELESIWVVDFNAICIQLIHIDSEPHIQSINKYLLKAHRVQRTLDQVLKLDSMCLTVLLHKCWGKVGVFPDSRYRMTTVDYERAVQVRVKPETHTCKPQKKKGFLKVLYFVMETFFSISLVPRKSA